MKSVFLDRDGVVIRDVNNLTEKSQLELLPNASESIRKLNDTGFKVILITNQPVIARGLVSESDVKIIHKELIKLIEDASGGVIDAVYYCPHHPNADVKEYRCVCDCRKPSPGMINRATREHHLSLSESFLVGDRSSDILAGIKAGVGVNILVQTGEHDSAPIFSGSHSKEEIAKAQPDYVCSSLSEAVEFILNYEK